MVKLDHNKANKIKIKKGLCNLKRFQLSLFFITFGIFNRKSHRFVTSNEYFTQQLKSILAERADKVVLDLQNGNLIINHDVLS